MVLLFMILGICFLQRQVTAVQQFDLVFHSNLFKNYSSYIIKFVKMVEASKAIFISKKNIDNIENLLPDSGNTKK